MCRWLHPLRTGRYGQHGSRKHVRDVRRCSRRYRRHLPLGGTGLLLGTFAGAAVWQTLENGLNMIGAQVGIQRLVIGIIVVFSVLLDVVVRSGNFGKKASK